jgi:energy-converting hydrogenase Eha subunit A
MEILIILLVIVGALVAIASGIWVALALGSAISKDDKKGISAGTKGS